MAVLAATGAMASTAGAAPLPLPSNLPAPTGAQVNKSPDVDTYKPHALVPDKTVSDGGVQPNDSAANGEYHCPVDNVTVANFPSGYVLGNCNTNVHVDVTRLSGLADGHYYYGGLINGNLNGCGWIRTDLVNYDNNNSYTGCADPSRANCDFIYCAADGTPYIFSDSSGQDGQTYALASGKVCSMFGNYRPWSSSNAPTDYQTTIYGPTNIKIRYLTKYTWGGSYWIMVHYGSIWGFVPQACL